MQYALIQYVKIHVYMLCSSLSFILEEVRTECDFYNYLRYENLGRNNLRHSLLFIQNKNNIGLIVSVMFQQNDKNWYGKLSISLGERTTVTLNTLDHLNNVYSVVCNNILISVVLCMHKYVNKYVELQFDWKIKRVLKIKWLDVNVHSKRQVIFPMLNNKALIE